MKQCAWTRRLVRVGGGTVTDHDDDRLEHAVTAVARMALLLDGPRLHAWDACGLSLPQLRILFRIRQAPGSGVTEVATALGVSASNITQQVEKLVSRGLMIRVERPENRRYVCLTLTPEGEQVAGEYSVTARSYLRRALLGLSEPELDQLTALLTRLLDQAPELAARPNVASASERKRDLNLPARPLPVGKRGA
jgi:DNA-binding MarR family transcriptional regulator